MVELSFKSGLVKDRVMKGPLVYSLFYLIHSMWIVLFFRNLTPPKAPAQSVGEENIEMAKAKLQLQQQQQQIGNTNGQVYIKV